ncbi:MAG: hypothetical protein ACK5XN_24685 [Bacteroidota bacterium]|jgi:hypothetical protein
MTAKELIEQLQQLDPDTRIFTNGYEGGYCDAEISSPKQIALNIHKEEWMGPHEDAFHSYYVKDMSKYTVVKGIIL